MLSWRNFLTSLTYHHSLRTKQARNFHASLRKVPGILPSFSYCAVNTTTSSQIKSKLLIYTVEHGQLFLGLLTPLRNIGHVLSSLLHTSCSPITGFRVSWYTYEIHGRNHLFQILPLSFLRGYATSHCSHAYTCMLDSSLAVSVYFRIGLGRAPRD